MTGLWADLLSWLLHSAAAVGLLLLVVAAITLAKPDPNSALPKLFATTFAFSVPSLGGFLAGLVWQRRPWSRPARFVWLSGLLIFAAASVWVSGLPAGAGVCAGCGAMERLWRTFFVVERGSGLMNGDGLLVGCWIPLATIGYSVGAALGLRA